MASIKREAAQALAVDMEAIFTHRQASVARSETLPSSTTTLRDDDLQMNSAIQDDSNSTPSSIDVLGHRVKALVKGVDKLQNLGIETNNLPLPKVIVVGEQSAGKSSLIEGISGITLPRSSGTCTRCPMQVTLTSAEDANASWHCTITLLKKYSHYPHTSQGIYGHWGEDQSTTEIIFAVVHTKSDLEDMIRRAQFAVLNPGDDVLKYSKATDISELSARVGFSPNIIKLDITDRDLPALSFVDLPGIISVTEDHKDSWLVEMVKALVQSYVENDNSIILLACSLETDMQNSRATQLIYNTVGAMERTVGCLTKPDRIPGEPDVRVLQNILGNKSFVLGHNYYVTLQPFQKMLERRTTQEVAREEEEKFFSKEPWAKELGPFSDRFGTKRLTMALSEKLAHQILLSLPSITEKVQKRLERVDSELATHPDPPANAYGRILEILNKFEAAVGRHIEGIPPSNVLRNDVRKQAVAFRIALEHMRPGLLVKTPPGFEKKFAAAVIVLSDDDSDVEMKSPSPIPEETPSNNRKRKAPITPQHASIKKLQTSQRPGSQTPQRPDDRTRQYTGKSFGLLDIRDTLGELTNSNVPNEIDPRAVDHLRSVAAADWYLPMEAFLKDVANVLLSKLQNVLGEVCVKWLNTEFHREASKIVSEFATSVMGEQKSFAKRALALEHHKPMTMNEKAIMVETAAILEQLTEARQQKRALEYISYLDESSGKVTPSQERVRKAKDKKIRDEIGEDPFKVELDVMARVRAYYTVASLRFLDYVVQGVQAEAFEKCRVELHSQLKLGLMLEAEPEQANEHATRLLAEDPVREMRRMYLKKEKKNLLEAQQWLAQLEIASK